MAETFRRHPLQSPERPDTFFGLVAGLYVAALSSPALLAAVAVWVSSDAAVLYLGMLGLVTAVTALVTTGVTRWPGLAVRLGASRLPWAFPALGLAATAGYFAFGTSVSGPAASGVGIAGFFAGMGAFLLGFALLAMTRTRYTDAVVDEDAVELAFSGGWPDRHRTWVVTGAVVVLVASAATILLQATAVVDWGMNLLGFGPAIVGVALSLGTDRTYRVTAHGLERSLPAARRFHPWETFNGFTVTDEAIVLHRAVRWRLDFRCARADVDDLDAVVAALERHLDRQG